MQVLDEQKRLKILTAATRLFAANPFHKVLLSDVAEAAGVGKGTLYIYFSNKDDLYLSVLYSGFSQLVEEIQRRLDECQVGPVEHLQAAIREIVQFASRNPHFFELMRTVPRHNVTKAKWMTRSRELRTLLESIIRRGVAAGVFRDPHPELTAPIIPGMVRSVLLDDTQGVLDPQEVTRHIVRLTLAALMAADPLKQRAP